MKEATLKIVRRMFLSLLFLLFLPLIVASAEFNHPELNWRTISTPHFFVYYHQKEEVFAKSTARIAEEVYPRITFDLGFKPSQKTPIIIKNYDDITGGYTSAMTGKIVIQAQSNPEETCGNLSWVREVIAHEFTHVITFAAIEESIFPLRRAMANLVLPMWFIEGLAQYEGEEWHSLKEMVVKDEVKEGRVMSEGELGAFYFFEGWGRISGYYQSESFVHYIFKTYGKDKISKILTDLRHQPILQFIGEFAIPSGEVALYPFPQFLNFDQALKNVVGKDSVTLYKEWQDWIIDKYSQKEELCSSLFTSERLLTSQGRKDKHPVFSPLGDKVAFVSDKGYDYAIFDLYLLDIRSKKIKRLDRQVNPFISFSPDGKEIIYSKTRFFRSQSSFLSDLYLVNINTGKSNRLTYGLRASQPSFSPDGKRVVFVKNEGGNSNLYLLERKTKRVFPLTESRDGLTQNFSPSFSPQGDKIVFTSFRKGKRDIYLLNIKNKCSVSLTLDRADDRSPAFSADGNKVYLISNREGGVFNLYSIDLKEKNKIKRETNVQGGIFEPNLSKDGKNIVFSVYHKERFSLYLISINDLRGKEMPLVKKENKKIAKYKVKENANYPSSPYRAKIKLKYLFPWVFFNEYRLSLSLKGYATDELNKHNFYFSTLLDDETEYILSYINRELTPTILTDIYNLRDYKSFEGKSYEEKIEGGGVGIEYLLTDKQSLKMSFNVENRDTYLFNSSALLKQWKGRVNTLEGSWGFSNAIPTVDSYFTRRGRGVYLGVEYSGEEIGSQLKYTSYKGEWLDYFPLGSKGTLAFRLLGKRVENRSLPLLLFSLGGRDSLRGYPEDYLKGENLILSSLECRFPLLRNIGGSSSFYVDSLASSLFFDAGDAWREDGKIDLKRDLGIEFRLRTLPFGKYPLILRWGAVWPLNYKDKSGKIFLRIGEAF
ncbi:PD40 domain-containing protein [Candidatus Aerophobetes bacterium]|nr:PD40 domain-containing protein [Candidatus Aerophobetes bacterium]